MKLSGRQLWLLCLGVGAVVAAAVIVYLEHRPASQRRVAASVLPLFRWCSPSVYHP